MSHAPESELEFCLSCEMMFLFGMMARAGGTPCRASNLLRALRQVRMCGVCVRAVFVCGCVGVCVDVRPWVKACGVHNCCRDVFMTLVSTCYACRTPMPTAHTSASPQMRPPLTRSWPHAAPYCCPQVREAGALGLLEGVGLRSAGDSRGLEAELAKQGALPLRLAALARFLLDHLAK